MNILLAIDQLSAEWMSSNGQTGKAPRERQSAGAVKTREPGNGLGPEPQLG
jgi:hypothetical protein